MTPRVPDPRISVPASRRSDLGEGPHWDGEHVLHVDILRGELHRTDITSGTTHTTVLAGPASFVVPSADGELVVGCGATVSTFARTTAGASRITVPLAAGEGARLNDGKCDPRGRLWFGTTTADRAPVSALYRWSDGEVTTVATGIGVSNGLGWDVARDLFYYIDSPTQRVDVFDYDLDTGEATARRPFVHVDPADGLPDGLTVDSEGGIWVSLFGGAEIRRYTPDGGLSERIVVPVTYPTSVTFAGPDLDTLAITTARHRLAPAQRREEPLAGALLLVDVGIHGLPGVPAAEPWLAPVPT